MGQWDNVGQSHVLIRKILRVFHHGGRHQNVPSPQMRSPVSKRVGIPARWIVVGFCASLRETTSVKDFTVVDRVIKNSSTNLWSSVSLFIGAPSVKTTPPSWKYESKYVNSTGFKLWVWKTLHPVLNARNLGYLNLMDNSLVYSFSRIFGYKEW